MKRRQIDEDHIANIALQSGLKEATCRDLLERGWTFIRSLDEPSKWVDPRASLPDYVPHNEPACLKECGVLIPHHHGFSCSINCPSCMGVCHPDCPAYQKNGAQYV